MQLREQYWRDTQELQDTIRAGNIERAIQLFRRYVGDGTWLLQIRFLRRALPLLSPYQLANYLSEIWQGSKQNIPLRLVLPLFQRATVLRDTVPVDWPDFVTVYRGDCFLRGRRLSLRSFHKVSWTSDRTVAVRFAARALEKIQSVCPGKGVPIVATGQVARQHILAFFMKYHEDQEAECIINPVQLMRVTWAVVQDVGVL